MFKMIGPEYGSKDLDLGPTKNLKIPSFDSMSSNVTFLIYINQMHVLEWFWKIVQNTFKFLGLMTEIFICVYFYCLNENKYCQAPSQIPNPKGPASTQSNPVKICSKGTGADTKILGHPTPNF